MSDIFYLRTLFPDTSVPWSPDPSCHFTRYGMQRVYNPIGVKAKLVFMEDTSVDDNLEVNGVLLHPNCSGPTNIFSEGDILAYGISYDGYVDIDVIDHWGSNMGVGLSDGGKVQWLPDVPASTSSSSSIDSSSSSSSSSNEDKTTELYTNIISQGHYDILPFSYIVERGIGSGSSFNFNYETASNNISYDALITFNTPIETKTSVFVPETDGAKYRHDPMFYADIIVDGKGIDKYSLRSQQNMYTKEDLNVVFNIPKFTWDNSIFGIHNSSSESSNDPQEGYVWIGTSDKHIKKVDYSSRGTSIVSSSNTPSEVYMITFSENNNDTYVTCYDYLSKYTCTSYLSNIDDFYENNTIANDNNVIALCDSSNLISVDSYHGKVIFRDKNTLEEINSYNGFDAPFKVKWSKYHNCYLVAGTNILWKFYNGIKTPVYTIKDYTIVDFDCSEDGIVGIILNGISDNIIRFLDKNLYSMLYSESISDKTARYCRYCQQGRFYVLLEVNSGDAYTTTNYLFNSITKDLSKTESTNSIITTTTTTTYITPVNKVEMIKPDVNSVWQKGTSQQIVWLSNASVSDKVKIELYKGIRLIDTISAETDNTGIYVWAIAESYSNGSNYKIKITRLAAGDITQYDITEEFTLTDIPQVTTTTTTKILDRAIGAEYNKYTNQVVIVLNNGLIGVFDLNYRTFDGLFSSGVNNVSCIAIRDSKTKKFNGITKARVFVGDKQYLSNKWDSGIIETDLTSIYYGGGNNLENGEKYYVNIQVYSEKYGWSEVQTKEFVMPK